MTRTAVFPDDPELDLLQFHPDELEICDAVGVNGLQLAASMAKVLFSGRAVAATSASCCRREQTPKRLALMDT